MATREYEDDKGSIKQLEGYAGAGAVDADGLEMHSHLRVEMPAELAALSEEELAAVDKAATKKLDILLMPILVALYILNYIDRQNIASAKLAGLTKDLGLTAQQYSTAVAVLFAGYVALQIPSNMVASKIKWPGIYICGMCAAWGIVSGMTGVVQNFTGLAICRVFLGFTEAAFFPGAVYLVSIFYEKRKMALRTAILYSGSQVGNAFGGLFALAILQLDGAHGIAGWRWLFIVEGILTVGCAIIFAFIIPNSPTSIRWLTPLEKQQLLYRLEVDRGTKDSTKEMSVWKGLKLACTDPKTWLLCACLQFNYITASVTNFFPIVVGGLGFSRTITLAITAPPYLICCVVLLINGWHSDKTRERWLHIICPFFVTILGNVIAIATTNTAARYFAMCILPPSFYASSIIILSWISSSITGPNVKRAIVYALINSLCNTPNIWTSYLYGNNGPRYILGFSVDLAAAVGVILAGTATYLYLKRQNARLERGEDTGIHGPSDVQIAAGFRYQL